MNRKHILVAFFLSMILPAAQAQDVTVGPVTISKSWSPPLPPVSENGAAYFTLSNHEMQADRLISASTPAAERVEFHTSVKRGSMIMMERMQAVELPAHGNVALQPGGMHIMLIGLKNPLVKDASFPLTLTFERAGTVTFDVPVKSPGGAANAPAMPPAMQHGKHTH